MGHCPTSLSNDAGDELPDDKSVSSGDGLSGDDGSLLMSDSEGTFAVLKKYLVSHSH